MAFQTTLSAASIAWLSTASILAMPAPSEARDACGRAYRFSYSQQRCVLRTDVSANRRFQRKADRYCGHAFDSRAYRWSISQQRCVLRTDVGPRLVQPAVVRPVVRPEVYQVVRPAVRPVVRPLVRPVIRPVIQLSL